MTYDITYVELNESFQSFFAIIQKKYLNLAKVNPAYRESIVDFWLSEFDESTLEEAERLNVLLPLIKWCVEHNVMTKNLEGELALYYKDYTQGKLDDILADYEAEEVIADLVWCYQTHFGKK